MNHLSIIGTLCIGVVVIVGVIFVIGYVQFLIGTKDTMLADLQRLVEEVMLEDQHSAMGQVGVYYVTPKSTRSTDAGDFAASGAAQAVVFYNSSESSAESIIAGLLPKLIAARDERYTAVVVAFFAENELEREDDTEPHSVWRYENGEMEQYQTALTTDEKKMVGLWTERNHNRSYRTARWLIEQGRYVMTQRTPGFLSSKMTELGYVGVRHMIDVETDRFLLHGFHHMLIDYYTVAEGETTYTFWVIMPIEDSEIRASHICEFFVTQGPRDFSAPAEVVFNNHRFIETYTADSGATLSFDATDATAVSRLELEEYPECFAGTVLEGVRVEWKDYKPYIVEK